MALQDLVLVAGHAALRAELLEPPERPENEQAWVLEPWQAGEVVFYLEHARRGILLAANNPAALLLFSGGRTRVEAGRWSEGESYRQVARRMGYWLPPPLSHLRPELDRRSATENYARDSFENLLFSLARFQQLVGHYPRTVTVVSWAFKAQRFELHRTTLRWPASSFRFVGVGEPFDLEAAEQGELAALQAFRLDPFGKGPELSSKKDRRNPFRLEHPYRTCPGLGQLFEFLLAEGEEYPGRFPWEA